MIEGKEGICSVIKRCYLDHETSPMTTITCSCKSEELSSYSECVVNIEYVGPNRPSGNSTRKH